MTFHTYYISCSSWIVIELFQDLTLLSDPIIQARIGQLSRVHSFDWRDLLSVLNMSIGAISSLSILTIYQDPTVPHPRRCQNISNTLKGWGKPPHNVRTTFPLLTHKDPLEGNMQCSRCRSTYLWLHLFWYLLWCVLGKEVGWSRWSHNRLKDDFGWCVC